MIFVRNKVIFRQPRTKEFFEYLRSVIFSHIRMSNNFTYYKVLSFSCY
jgi:hypothetical protein